ncbi:MAG: hypothetical protein LBV37_00605, partial [Mycoplasmataceae bacterium]|nr:hypothetical protein [Mycoplasmataceae bacterium]
IDKRIDNDNLIVLASELKPNKPPKLTIADVLLEMREGFKAINARIDKLEDRIDRNNLKP